MKTQNSIRFALLAAAALFTHTAFAGKPPPPPPPPQPSSGTLVLNFSGPAGIGAYNWGLAAAPSGTVYALGNYWPNDANSRQLVLSSSDSGHSWLVLDDYAPPERYVDFWFGLGGGIALDSASVLYVTGRSYDDLYLEPGEPEHWYVRRSSDGGATWVTVDDFVMKSSATTDEMGIAVDAAGDVYVSGCDFYSSGSDWIIRKGVGGTSFSTVDFLPNSYPKDIFVHPTAGIFVVGSTQVTIKNQTSSAWLVRRSTDGGATWSNVDTFQLSSGKYSGAWGFSANASGIYVVGAGGAVNKGLSSDHWIVRKSTNGGSSWTTVDNYQLAADNYSSARCVAADAYGNLFVAGRGEQGGNDGTFSHRYWVVRKSAGGTGPWTTADVFQNGASGTTPNAIAADAFGNVFVAGDDGGNWLIKRY